MAPRPAQWTEPSPSLHAAWVIEPPSTLERPSRYASASAWPSPFCTLMATPSGERTSSASWTSMEVESALPQSIAAAQVPWMLSGTGPAALSKEAKSSGGTTSIEPSGVCITRPISESSLAVVPRATATISASVSARAPRRTPPIEPTPRMAIRIMRPPSCVPRSAG